MADLLKKQINDIVKLEQLSQAIICLEMCDEKNKNIYTDPMIEGIVMAFDFINEQDWIKVVILKGLPNYFCCGASVENLENLEKGAYILDDTDGKPDIILIASGSEVHIAVEAKQNLEQKGIAARVVNMPSWELFEQTPRSYKDSVLLPDVKARIAVEAGIPMGWERYVGTEGAIIGITGFGTSAPGGTVMKEYGFTADNIVKKAMEILN